MSYLIESLPSLRAIILQDCSLDAAVLLKFGTGWPQLGSISLDNNQLDAKSVLAITQAKSLAPSWATELELEHSRHCTHAKFTILLMAFGLESGP